MWHWWHCHISTDKWSIIIHNNASHPSVWWLAGLTELPVDCLSCTTHFLLACQKSFLSFPQPPSSFLPRIFTFIFIFIFNFILQSLHAFVLNHLLCTIQITLVPPIFYTMTLFETLFYLARFAAFFTVISGQSTSIVVATSFVKTEYPSITSAIDAKSASNVPAQTHTVDVGNVGFASLGFLTTRQGWKITRRGSRASTNTSRTRSQRTWATSSVRTGNRELRRELRIANWQYHERWTEEQSATDGSMQSSDSSHPTTT